MREEYKPNPIIVAKACDLWCQMLTNPKFDALGANCPRCDDPHGSMAIAQMMAAVNATCESVSPETLTKFRESLTRLLMSKTVTNYKTYEVIPSEDGYYGTSLHVDYHPDAILAQAGKDADVPETRWPWKTSMYLSGGFLSLSYGYGAEHVYYYPFDGKWLVTTLHGSDISKVFEYVRGGKPEFVVVSEVTP